MARKKRMRTMETNAEYLSQQDLQGQSNSEVQAQGEIDLYSELPPGGCDVVIEDNEGGRRTRGKTRLCHLWQLPEGHRIVVNENPIFQPVGAEAGLLGQYLGTLARNGSVCSMSFPNWKLLKKVAKSDILFLIKERFIYHPKCEKHILKSLNVKWNQHKSTLKSLYFNEDKPLEEMFQKVPKDVYADQWIYLVNYWSSPKGKETSERNKKARAMLKNPHTAGTKSFARHGHEMKLADPEKREPSRAKLFLKTHKHDEVAVAIEKHLEENPEAASNSEGKVAWEGDALSQVLGKDTNGYIRGIGLVADPKLVLQPTKHFEGMDTTMLNEKSLLCLVREMSRNIEILQATAEDLRSEINQLKRGASETTNDSSHNSSNEDISPAPNANGDFMNLLTSVSPYCGFGEF